MTRSQRHSVSGESLTPQHIARVVLAQSYRAHVGHIGSSLSVAALIATLYRDILHIPSLDSPDRDRFILSKGHAALALYAALYLRGDLSEEALNTYCGDGTLLGVHPERNLSGIDFCTGSLGHGLSLGVGAALAARLQGSTRRAFVLMSDAECNEGSVWEAAMFAAQHRLANLVAIVDMNGQQALGYTQDVLDLTPMGQRWRAFGWDVHTVDGHNVSALTKTFTALGTQEGQPHIVLAKTVFGKGVSFMEHEIAWHYLPMTDKQYQRAVEEIGRME